MPGLDRLQADILERWDAEEKASLARTIRNLFDDPRRASASVGVSIVASLCLAFGAFVVAQSPIRHPESLKAVMTQSERSRMADIYLPETSIELPRADAEAVMPATVINRDRGDEVAFAALVTADGYLEELEYLGERRGRRSPPATHEQLSQPPQCRRHCALRARPRRRRSRLLQRRLAGDAHDRSRPACARIVRVRVDGWKRSSSLR